MVVPVVSDSCTVLLGKGGLEARIVKSLLVEAGRAWDLTMTVASTWRLGRVGHRAETNTVFLHLTDRALPSSSCQMLEQSLTEHRLASASTCSHLHPR